MRDRCLAAAKFTNYAKVDRAQVAAICFVCSPGSNGVAYATDPERACEIIATTARNHENGNFQSNQFGQMTMNRAIPAEDDCHVSLLNERSPLGPGRALKERYCAGATSWAENRSSAHAQELDHRERSDATASLASSWGVEAEGSIGSGKAMLYQAWLFSRAVRVF